MWVISYPLVIWRGLKKTTSLLIGSLVFAVVTVPWIHFCRFSLQFAMPSQDQFIKLSHVKLDSCCHRSCTSFLITHRNQLFLVHHHIFWHCDAHSICFTKSLCHKQLHLAVLKRHTFSDGFLLKVYWQVLTTGSYFTNNSIPIFSYSKFSPIEMKEQMLNYTSELLLHLYCHLLEI